jgi:hypothetical protein
MAKAAHREKRRGAALPTRNLSGLMGSLGSVELAGKEPCPAAEHRD